MAHRSGGRSWFLVAVMGVGALAALVMAGSRLQAQCGGSASGDRHVGGSAYPGDDHPRQAPVRRQGNAAGAEDACPLEPTSLGRLVQELDLDSRQEGAVARAQRSYVDRVSPIEGRIDSDRQELARTLDTDRVDAKRARRLVSSIGQSSTDLQQTRLDAYLQIQSALTPDQVRRLPFCPYLLPGPQGGGTVVGPH